ncbi:hypothetical protein ATCC90586_003149 [Pythium insidiosum]|nr:hypothetical protein ATCC90586_003149 [Pythium insidiosum]
MEALLENQLQGRDGLVSTTDALAQKKFIGLYFSAHWCPPCREFTPMLAQVYEEIKRQHDDLEVVFVSYDKTQEQFEEYFAEMPWLALPYAKRDLKAAIGKKLGIMGVPMLVFVDDKGQVIETDGRELVEDNVAQVENIITSLRNGSSK